MAEQLAIDQASPQLLIWAIRTRQFDNSRVVLEGTSLIKSSETSDQSLNYRGAAWLINSENVQSEVEISIYSCLTEGSRFETWLCSKSVQSYDPPWLLTDRPNYTLVYDGEIDFEIDQGVPATKACSFFHTPVYGDGWFGIISRKWRWNILLQRRKTWHLIAFSTNSSFRLSAGKVFGQSPTDSLVFGEYSVPERSDQV